MFSKQRSDEIRIEENTLMIIFFRAISFKITLNHFSLGNEFQIFTILL